MEQLGNTFANIGLTLTDIAIPILILIGGWIAALFISKAVVKLLNKTSIDERLAKLATGSSNFSSAAIVGKVVFWVIILFTVAAFLARLKLAFAAEPINAFLGGIFKFAPRVLGAIVLAIVAWVCAKIVKNVVRTLLEKTSLDGKMAEEMGSANSRPSSAIAEAAHWLVYLLFLPAILATLQIKGILGPVEGMLTNFLGFIPNLLSAAIIFVVGLFVAKIVQKVVSSALTALGIDRGADKIGLSQALGNTTFSKLLGMIVFVLIIIPVSIAALDALKMTSITAPASQMLTTILNAIPNIFGAGIILAISYFVGRFISGLVSNILSSAGFDNVLFKLGIAKTAPRPGTMKPSKFVGTLILVSLMLFATMEAVNLLGFEVLSDLISRLMVRGGQVVLGLIIFAAGLLLGEFAAKAIRGTGMNQANLLATVAKVAITGLAAAMGLGEMNISGSIIPLAFGLSLGAVAVAVALAFGLGARDQAAEMVREWRTKWKNQN